MRFGSAGDPFRWYISHPAKCGPFTSHCSRLPSAVSRNAPLRVPTSTRTLLIGYSPGSDFSGCGRHGKRLVGAAAVDGRHMRIHGSQIGGELAAMMHRVLDPEVHVQHHRKIEDVEETRGRGQMLAGKRGQFALDGGHVLIVERQDLRDSG